MKEVEFQRYILSAFEHEPNIMMFRRNVGGMRKESESGKKSYVCFGEAGQSDLYGWIVEHRCRFCNKVQYGTHFEIEVKSDKGKPTATQLAWLNKVAQSNGIAILLYPKWNDPIGLRERVLKMLVGQKCPQCVARSKF